MPMHRLMFFLMVYKQRLLLARSLIHKPQLVILDEPTVGLDPYIRRQLWDYIKMLKKRWNYCIVDHALS